MNPSLRCNDIHSKLNPTRVAEVLFPQDEDDVIRAVVEAKNQRRAISICGGRHAMGGQQFGEDTLLLDMTGLDFVKPVDRVHGTVEVGCGIQWPALLAALHAQQEGEETVWTIRQKQTGADNLTIGGALAANIHGRGLRMKPFVDDIECFRIVDAEGVPHHCSRTENEKLFALAIGGYGCFGIVTAITLRLSPRIKLQRIVEVTTLDLLPDTIRERIGRGCLYGDFQFSIDEQSDDFLWKGVLSSYRPVSGDPVIPTSQTVLNATKWQELVTLAHHDRKKAFQTYADYYLSTHGQLYYSDIHQLSMYVNDYHEQLNRDARPACQASEMITELYVPHDHLISFMKEAATLLRSRGVAVIYGTMRLIRKDSVSFLSWAQSDFACVIFNLHTEHSEEGIAQAAQVFQSLIDLAISFQGSYFLTYHRWARRDQIEAAHPNFAAFLSEKLRLDPQERFQSNWWRHHRDLFSLFSNR
ncbi:FAD-binding oxidoreductase [Roseibacillus persicicus]|nr:FAD-binding oxidoreductase [Roseibacillus persicicus]